MNTVIDEENFQTNDLGLASALQALSIKLLYIDRTNPKRATFCYELTSRTQDIVDAFWDNRLPIDAGTYFQSIKQVKDRLYSEWK